MKTKIILLLYLLFVSCESTTASANSETTIRHEIYAESLEGNLINEPTTRAIYVCVPPDYNSTSKRYPVVYYLSGFGLSAEQMIEGSYYETRMGEIYDSLITNNVIEDFLLVIADGKNLFAGSFYVNSPVTGNWEDFIIDDVVGFVDDNYRTIQSPECRGITGHSMGGFGSIYLGFRHPDIFGSVYAMSPAIFDENGLNDEGMFSDEQWIRSFVARHEKLEQMPRQTALDSLVSELEGKLSFNLYFEYAYGTSFVPDTSHPPYLQYPYALVNDELVVDNSLMEKYQDGVGNLGGLVDEYLQEDLRLKKVALEYGTSDEFRWIPNGCKYFRELLDEASIENSLSEFDGLHGDKIKERLCDYVMPFFSEQLFTN